MGKISGSVKAGGNAVKYGASQAAYGVSSGVHAVAHMLYIIFTVLQFVISPFAGIIALALVYNGDFFSSFGEMIACFQSAWSIAWSDSGRGQFLPVAIVSFVIAFFIFFAIARIFKRISDSSENAMYSSKATARNAKQDFIDNAYEATYGNQDARIGAMKKSGRFSER